MLFQHEDNGQLGEFFAVDDTGERIAEITYVWSNAHTIIANHTWVDDFLRGQGVARQLVDVLVEFAREKNIKILPTCSYVEVMFRRDKKLADIKYIY